MSFNAGEMVGPYRIIGQLGQGGMATVFKAYHAALDRYVAIKVLHPAFLEDPSFLTRFQREARLVAKLEHPNIVPIYDYTEHEGRPYLVMKYIEGETLKATLSRGLLSKEEVARVVDSVGTALAFAHKSGILHRDIKPSNVLMAADGQIYLSDFGLARIAQSGGSTLTSDMILGTPQYISPEQALGKKDLDEGTDIYSFGVLLYELTVGKVPFNADTPFSIIHDHIYSPLPMPRHVNPAVSEAVERVLLKALAKDRRDRYKDVHALVDAFQIAWKEGDPELPDTMAAQLTWAATTSAISVSSMTPNEAPPMIPVPIPEEDSAVSGATHPLATVQAGEASQPIVQSQSSNGQVQTQTVKPRAKLGWLWLAVAIVLIIGFLVTLFAIRSIKMQVSSNSSLIPTITQTFITTQTTGTVSEISIAKQYMATNPDDPQGYLALAMAYVDANMPEAAHAAITNLEKSGKADETTDWDFGHQFADKNAWLFAARLDLDAAEMHLKTGPLSNDLEDQLQEAVYKAYRNRVALIYLPILRLSAIDISMATIAKSRYEFYFGDQTNGQKILDQLNLKEPNFPEAQLLQAEFSAKEGDTTRARQALINLENNPATTEWMLAAAKSIEGTLL
jgi:serine/threonine protein kinase